MWIDKLKEKSVEIVFALIVFLILLFADNIVDQYITPRMVNNLQQDGYLKQDIKEGKYVVSDEIAFADNHTIRATVLNNLNNNAYMTVTDAQALSDRVTGLEAAMQAELKTSAQALETAQQEIQELNELIKALTSKEIDVTLFVSDLESDRGYAILNINNRAISEILKNNQRYYIKSNDGERLKLKARIEPTPADNYDANAAIGRLHRDDYHELFSGTQSGTRVASIVFD